MSTSKADRPRIIELPRIYDPRGNLTFIQNGDLALPFDIARAFWTYDIPREPCAAAMPTAGATSLSSP